MNGEQLKLFIENSLQLRRAVERTARKTNPELKSAMVRIRSIVESIPDDSLIKEQQWRQLRPLLRYILGDYNRLMEQELLAVVEAMHPIERKYALDMLAQAGVNVAGAVDDGTAVSASKIQATSKFPLSQLFAVAATSQESPWVKSILRVVDRKVMAGLTFGKTTAEIANDIVKIQTRQGRVTAIIGGTAAGQVESYAQSVIRNVVESMTEEEMERAVAGLDMNEEGQAWEYIALLDSNTCATCAWWDGEVERDKTRLPRLPMHDNCQCSIVPVELSDPDSARPSLQLDPDGLGQRKKPPPLDPAEGADTRKGDISRKEHAPYTKTRFVIADRPGNRPRYADYLVQTNPYDRAMFFGGGNAGQVRAQRFMELVEQGNSPKRALKLLINGDSRNKRFDRVSSL